MKYVESLLEERIKELENKVLTQQKVRSIWGKGYHDGVEETMRKVIREIWYFYNPLPEEREL